ncbi:hypothetical protein K8O68_01550 [Salipaludibacillus sp. CUR1]|uniref:hypothetical protein n=1 Tax=Salipaludibacillus sp. CUR1 TaxID=2820003 RepID=UPI001E4FDC78|nr:hypothetical protein [Salipaludibacillus sp. CUR1]MCE7791100.1 hypothetical protein [Salipaludibacillus sp. CUR1]
MPLEADTKKTETFIQAFATMEEAFPYARKMYQPDVLQAAARVMEEPDGMRFLYEYADRFDSAGIFEGGPWAEPSKLEPRLVTGSLMDNSMTAIVEILSELRMVSLAKGKHQHESFTQEDAKEFLDNVLALNVDILFPEETEAARIEGRGKEKDRAERLFQFLADELTLTSITSTLIDEIDGLVAQRPIMVNRIITMVFDAEQLLKRPIGAHDKKAIKKYIQAVTGPTKLCKEIKEPCDYRKRLKEATEKELQEEAKAFAKSMRSTGLVSDKHVILVRYLNREKKDLLPMCLALSKKGTAHLEEHYSIVSDLIKVAIHPPTRQALYGLTLMLERGILSANPVIPGLRRLIELDLLPEVRKILLNSVNKSEGVTANDILVAGTISVLGQPLGIGQGMNPTCQTARGISLWSLHAPGYLLELIPRAARDGDIDIMFEGQAIHSKNLREGLVDDLHEELDPVSLVLVPHLDRIYGELVRRAEFRGEDVHKWVNPAFYGNWVNNGFSSAIDPMTGSIADYSGFVRLFYSTHHPEYNDGHELIYPNPVGIFITNSFGELLGLHAVSIQRVAKDPKGNYRIYFYNPNNDSSQVWGQGIEPAVAGNGEIFGESSLPFHEFTSRLYAFHYNPYEQGDAFAVDKNYVEKIEELARTSWGVKYTWVEL